MSSTVTINASGLGNNLQRLLTTNDEITPGAEPSYELCKLIYTYHPLGAKLVEKPIEIAQSQLREITVPDSPETRVKEAFEDEWRRINASHHIMNCARLARVYGIASIAMLTKDVKTEEPVDLESLWKAEISFNAYDPLNTAGSLVLNQNPLAMDFQHTTDIRVNGSTFHRSRTCVIMNESPIYIQYTNSAFGFVGRSVYQRSLYPLKSFLQTMITDDLVARKSGVLVAKMKQAGSIIDNAMQKMFGVKRNVVKEAETNNVISIGDQENVESLNLQNLEGPLREARKHILENIAAAAGMPAKLITEESLAEGFGEGTEDAKAIARYIDRVREQLQPLYDYFDKIVMHRAWNPDFYATIQREFPEYREMSYNQAFYKWKNAFVAKWPSLLTEPDSEMVKVDEVKLRAVIAWVQVLLPELDQENKARIIEWATDNFNNLKFLFDQPLELDYEEIASKEPPMPEKEHVPAAPKPFASLDSMGEFNAAVSRLLDKKAMTR